jgi:hypothetical protein
LVYYYFDQNQLLLILAYRKKLHKKCAMMAGSLAKGLDLAYAADTAFHEHNKYYSSYNPQEDQLTTQQRNEYKKKFYTIGNDRLLKTWRSTDEMEGHTAGVSVGSVRNAIVIAFDISRTLYPNDRVEFGEVTNIPGVSNLRQAINCNIILHYQLICYNLLQMLEMIDEVRASYDAPPSSNVEPSITEDVNGSDTDDDDANDGASGAGHKDYIHAVRSDTESDSELTPLVINEDNEEKDPLRDEEPPILSDQNQSFNESDDIAVRPSTSGFNLGHFDALNPSNSDEIPSPVSTIKSIFEVYMKSNPISFYILFQRMKPSMSEEKSVALMIKRMGNNNTE